MRDSLPTTPSATDPSTVDPPATTIGRRTVTRAAIWRLADGIGSEACSFVFFLILGRLLTPTDFGIVAIAGVFVQACVLVLRSGYALAIVQCSTLSREYLTAALWGNVGVGTTCAAAVIIIAWPLSLGQHRPILLPIVIGLSPVLLLMSVCFVYQAELKRELRFDVTARNTILSMAGGGITGVLLAWWGAGSWSLVGQQVAGAAISLAAFTIGSTWRPLIAIPRRHLRQLTAFAGKTVLSSVFDFAGRRADAAVLGFFFSAHAIGTYFVASRLTFTVSMFTGFVIGDIAFTTVSRLQASSQASSEAAYHVLRLTTLFTLPAFIGLALVAEPAISILFGSEWIESALPLQMMSLLSTAYALNLSIRVILEAANHPQLAAWLACLTMGLAFAFLIGAAPFGLAPAALAGGLAYLVSLPVAIVFLNRVTGTQTRRIVIEQAPIWLATVIMAVVVAVSTRDGPFGGFGSHPLADLGSKASLGALTFMVCLRIFAPGLFADEVVRPVSRWIARWSKA